MGEQTSRVYYEIIEEVCNKLAEEGVLYDIDNTIIHDIQTDWIKNIEHVKRERAESRENGHGLADSGNEGGFVMDNSEEDYDIEDQVDLIEQNIRYYMMCLFIKVAKSKNKWKCSFKQGFINVDNEDIPFSTATGELEW